MKPYVRLLARILLGVFLMSAGYSHMTSARMEFQAQVPDWFPMDKDLVVILSGIVEMTLGAALISGFRKQIVGLAAAAFFIAIFPGNIAQFIEGKNAFGLDSDRARAIRLLFQPLLVLWALWATDAFPVITQWWKSRKAGASQS
ncbi:hypothetical protein KEM60_01546 [Austwickia sp. TVS 96-490-7B]|uniref:DoxX family protein n=1 Tax=Austwickia sp. TVS 96-490-7B TaxID=2830843 RepID=UPI001C5A3AFE|nr:DoxX family membrane protein [Austwickia sp. TVS 96-490-7B]MBW3085349.1 hypothetical protein [Austwickia sp. TVS 96-490-7B]